VGITAERQHLGGLSSGAAVKKVWLATDGRPYDSVLAIFSTREAAKRYCDTLVERYALGESLSLMGRRLADSADAWRLGLGPTVVEGSLDENVEFLRGAWVVKVDESCRMIACEFSTELKPTVRRRRLRILARQAHGMTPQAALDAARKAMVAHLGRTRT
jgi:hypothetical protein